MKPVIICLLYQYHQHFLLLLIQVPHKKKLKVHGKGLAGVISGIQKVKESEVYYEIISSVVMEIIIRLPTGHKVVRPLLDARVRSVVFTVFFGKYHIH